jgi:hypothetical protein
MPDYAISAVGSASTQERLLDTGSNNEVLRFQEVGSRQGGSWDPANDFRNQIRITQDPSSNAHLKSEKTPWDNVAKHTLDKLDDVQQRWDKTMKPSVSSGDFLQGNRAGETGPKAIKAELQNLVKAFYRLTDAQVRVAIVTSVATTVKKSISTLYRQQG